MGNSKLYPLTPNSLEAAVRYLVETGRHLSGKSSATPKPAYFLNFRILGLADAIPTYGDLILIDGRTTPLFVECEVHKLRFSSTPRCLLNTSDEYQKTTCRFCERDANEGRNFSTLGEIEARMAADDHFDWVLDITHLPLDQRNPDRIIGSDDRLPLKCKRNKWNSDDPCAMPTSHRWNNIQTALDHDPEHIRCQGPCDSQAKGKKKRKPLDEFERELAEARSGTWRLSSDKSYRKMSESQWFTHTPCGQEVKRYPYSVVEFPYERGLPPNSDEDCPYCKRSSPLDCLDQSIAHYRKWVSHVTEDCVSFKGTTFPESDDLLNLQCECRSVYQAKQEALITNVYFGCPSCRAGSATALRAWKLDEAREIVARRGMALSDDPGSYTTKATITGPNCTDQPFTCILDLVRAYPASATGFEKRKKASNIPENTENTGLPYNNKDIAWLRANASTMTYREIARALRRTEGSVKQQFRRLGLRNDQRPHFNRTVNVRDDAFSVLTSEVCYWAGLIATDGCVTDKNELKIELKAFDENVLQKFCQFVGFKGPLKYRTMTKIVEGRGIYASMQFRSQQILADLKRHFGITPRKTYILPAPSISDDWAIKAYMLGMIEGDGHINRIKRNELLISFISAAPDCFNWFLNNVMAIVGKELVPSYPKDRPHISVLSVHCGDAEALRDALLAVFPGYMTRKWNT